jgi:hypothetical protein
MENSGVAIMNRVVSSYIKRVENALECANTGTTKLTESEFALAGMSSKRNRILLNELVKSGDKYLEIGVWQGATFVSALYKNEPAYAVAIDNFSQFDPNSENSNTFKRVTTERGITDFTLLNADCFNLPKNLEEYVLNRKFNVYFYDGPHTAVDQYKALFYYYMCLADEFIVIVDDFNNTEVQSGTYAAIGDLQLKVHKDWVLKSAGNGDRETWWNGLYVAVCEKTQ